jgi:hypothetical protein
MNKTAIRFSSLLLLSASALPLTSMAQQCEQTCMDSLRQHFKENFNESVGRVTCQSWCQASQRPPSVAMGQFQRRQFPKNVGLQCEESCVNRFGLSMAQARGALSWSPEGKIWHQCLMQCTDRALARSAQQLEQMRQNREQWLNSLPVEQRIQVLQQENARADARRGAVSRHNAECQQSYDSAIAGGTSSWDAAVANSRCVQY